MEKTRTPDWAASVSTSPAISAGSALNAATTAPGFPTSKELAKLYADRSPLDLSVLPYYVAFAYWKLACIVEGVYVRYASGAMGKQDDSSAFFADMVIDRAEKARAALR